MLVRVEHAALVRGRTEPGEVCEVVGLGPVPVTRVVEMIGAGEAVVYGVLTRGDDVLRTVAMGRRRDALGSPTGTARLSGRAAHVVLVRVRSESLLDDRTSTLEPAVPDPVVAALASRGQAVSELVHRGRRVTAAQRIALLWRDPSCSVVGCPNQGWLQIDHRHDWADTHVTTLWALDRLCAFHHDLKTRRNWSLVDGTGKRAMVPPTDPRHPGHRTSDRAGPAGSHRTTTPAAGATPG